jgi:hypothetical protein
VFGWAIHYFWEENLDWKKSASSKAKKIKDDTVDEDTETEDSDNEKISKPIANKPKAQELKKKKGIVSGQLSLFD